MMKEVLVSFPPEPPFWLSCVHGRFVTFHQFPARHPWHDDELMLRNGGAANASLNLISAFYPCRGIGSLLATYIVNQ